MGRGCQGDQLLGGTLVKHFNRATLFAECKHGPLTVRTRRTRHSELGNLRAVSTGETSRGSDQAGTRQWVASYWLSEVMDPLGWSKPTDGDGSVLTSGYKSIMG